MDEPKKKRSRHQPKGVLILHEDRDIVVVDKAPGFLTMGTDRDKERTAYSKVTDYVRKGNVKSRERIFIVHRLDREVSGILVFARTEEAKKALQAQWGDVEKHYLALVHGRPAAEHGVFSSYLHENGVHNVTSNDDPKGGRLSKTEYTFKGQVEGVSLLDINLLTGRKHQIRVHLSVNNLPILGDKKYGDRHDGARRLALHAKSIAFEHPYHGRRCVFETRVPRLFAGYSG